MQGVFEAKYCSLHVRVSNAAAIHLYVDILGYEKNDIEKKYYADGEDAHDMRKTFKRLAEEVEGGWGGRGAGGPAQEAQHVSRGAGGVVRGPRGGDERARVPGPRYSSHNT